MPAEAVRLYISEEAVLEIKLFVLVLAIRSLIA